MTRINTDILQISELNQLLVDPKKKFIYFIKVLIIDTTVLGTFGELNFQYYCSPLFAAEELFSVWCLGELLSTCGGGNLSSFGGGLLCHCDQWPLSCCSKELCGTSLVALAVVFLNYCSVQGTLYICSVQTPLSFWHVVNKLAVAGGSL